MRPAGFAFTTRYFNGVMGKLRARELGFDACMYIAAQDLRGAEGRRRPGRRALWLLQGVGAVPADARWWRARTAHIASTTIDRRAPARSGVLGQRAAGAEGLCLGPPHMGAEGINEASDLSVLANNYMGQELGGIRGLTRSNPT